MLLTGSGCSCVALSPYQDSMEWKDSLASAVAESQVRELVVYLLGNVPGLPPIVQSLHIFGIAVVMGSIVMIDLRFLGMAVPSQSISEMIRRLMPWTWWALLLNAATGSVFVVARPLRYFYNPIFGWKFTFLVPAVALVFVVHRLSVREQGYWDQSLGRRVFGRLTAGVSLLLWIGVVMAGRWIAYSDYLYYYE